MLDAFLVDDLEARDGSLVARCGRALLIFEASPRDIDELCSRGFPTEVYTQIEVDLSVPSSATLVALAFSTPDRRRLYRDVVSIKLIGRASALAVLDSGEVRDTLRAVAGADLGYFQSVPGLGKKKAEAVIAGLKVRYQGYLPKAIKAPVLLLVEARDALVGGGEDPAVAEARLLAALEDGAKPTSAEAWLELLDS